MQNIYIYICRIVLRDHINKYIIKHLYKHLYMIQLDQLLQYIHSLQRMSFNYAE